MIINNNSRKRTEYISEMVAIPGERLLNLGMPYRTRQTTDTKYKNIYRHTDGQTRRQSNNTNRNNFKNLHV